MNNWVLSKFLGILTALSLPAAAASLFTDVPDNHWARHAVAALAAKALLRGNPDGTFGDLFAVTYSELVFE